MSRIIVEYNPPISRETQKLIRDKVSPSMESLDGTSCQYDIGIVIEEISEANAEDTKLIMKLIEEGVSYIEI